MSCKKCGGRGHYAKTCDRKQPEPGTRVRLDPKRATAPESTPRAPAPKAKRRGSRCRNCGAKEHRTRGCPAIKEKIETLLKDIAALRDAEEAKTRPWKHTTREGPNVPEFLWRHEWTHDTTRERLVATVPVPPSGDRYEHADGLVAPRRAEGADEILRMMPHATVDLIGADGVPRERFTLGILRAFLSPRGGA